MSQIVKKFIGNDQVDGTKIRLNNNESLRARNNAGSGDVSILKVNASDQVDFNANTLTNLGSPSNASDAATKGYVDTQNSNFANKTLSNLTSPTSINQDLLPDADVTRSLGSATDAWSHIFTSDVQNRTGSTLALKTQNTSSASTNSQVLALSTGNASGATSDSGNITLTTGTATGTRGSITLDGFNINLNAANQISANNKNIVNVADPVSAQDAATKAYVDALSQGVAWKNPVRAISTTDITLSGNQTIDGVSLVDGDRVLVAGQTTDTDNGIYIVSSGAWTRSLDADTGTELVAAAVFVDEGTANARTAWVQTTPAPITIGSSSILFSKFASTTPYVFRNGLTQTGQNVDVAPGDNSLTSTPGSLIVKEDPAGAIVTGGSGIKVQVDSVTSKINGSNQIESLKGNEQLITLSGTDITNQYVDLAHAVYGTSASVNSITLSVIGGLIQQKTVDYTVSLTGGSGGVTRITFAGDLATGGNAALVSGDKLVVQYDYLT